MEETQDGALVEHFARIDSMLRTVAGIVARGASTTDVGEIDENLALIDEQLDAFGLGPPLDVFSDLWSAALRHARATLLLERYHLMGVLGDLAGALDESRSALEGSWALEVVEVPPLLRARLLSGRSRALSRQYELTHTREQLEESIALMVEAIELDPEEPLHLAELALSYGERYSGPLFDADADDLDRAIELLERALAQSSDTDLNWTPWMGSLGVLHSQRFDRTGALADLDAAMTAASAAVDTAVSDQDRVPPLFTVAKVARRRDEAEPDPDVRATGLAALDRAVDLATEWPTSLGLDAARFAVRWRTRLGDSTGAAVRGRQGLAMLAELRTRQARNADVEVWLRQAIGIAADTAWALVDSGAPDAAAAVLEANRSTILSELLPDTSELAGGPPELLDELRDVLAAAADEQRSDRDLLALRARRRALIDELEAAVGSDGADVLSAADLRSIAAAAPLCYLASSLAGTFGILVTADACTAFRLDDDGGRRAADEVERFWRDVPNGVPRARSATRDVGVDGDAAPSALERIVGWLDDTIVGPVHERCGAEVVVIPTGDLAGLPIDAAAGHLADWRSAPSARALRAAGRRLARASGTHLVAIAEPHHDRTVPLPGAAREVDEIAPMYPGATVLTGTAATAEAVLAAVRDADVLHVACHGIASPREPMSSALLLAGPDRLLVRDLISRVALADTRLAILSACQTGVVGATVPDEAISLANGVLHAGAAGVIASLWAVPDGPTSDLMIDLHRRHRAGAHPLTALRAAQQAMRTGELGDGRWTHPVNWAAFSYLGT